MSGNLEQEADLLKEAAKRKERQRAALDLISDSRDPETVSLLRTLADEIERDLPPDLVKVPPEVRLAVADFLRALDDPANLNGHEDRLRSALDDWKTARSKTAEPPSFEQVTGARVLDSIALAAEVAKPVPWVIEPILIRGELTQIHGPPKGGKSAFSLYLSTCAALGHWITGEPFICPPRKVLYISWEDAAGLVGYRVREYMAGLGLPSDVLPCNLHVVDAPKLWLNVEDHALALEREIKHGGYDVVVLDTLSYAHSVDEDKADEIKPIMARLREIARNTMSAILYIHHRRKSGDVAKGERGRGSSSIGAAPVCIIDWGDRGESNVTPVWVQTKRGFSGKLEIEYFPGPGSVRWKINMPDRPSREDKHQKVLSAMKLLAPQYKDGIPGSVIVSVMDGQGIKKSRTYDFLNYLTGSGQISQIPKGKATLYTIMQIPGETPI